jgi:hypothetical protein
MVSSKLNIKKQNRNKLFYGKFLYKAVFETLGIRFIFRSKSMSDCLDRIKKFNRRQSIFYAYSQDSIKIDDLDMNLLEKTFCFHKKYQDSNQVTFLRSGYNNYTFTMFTNDISILEELVDICSDTEIVEAITPPSEIMYFAKEPKYKYRVYLKNKVFSEDILESLKTFYMTNHNKGNIWLSSGIFFFVMNSRRGYLPSGCFIDYNDEQTLTMMHLLFGECLRKSCKLEKRP